MLFVHQNTLGLCAMHTTTSSLRGIGVCSVVVVLLAESMGQLVRLQLRDPLPAFCLALTTHRPSLFHQLCCGVGVWFQVHFAQHPVVPVRGELGRKHGDPLSEQRRLPAVRQANNLRTSLGGHVAGTRSARLALFLAVGAAGIAACRVSACCVSRRHRYRGYRNSENCENGLCTRLLLLLLPLLFPKNSERVPEAPVCYMRVLLLLLCCCILCILFSPLRGLPRHPHFLPPFRSSGATLVLILRFPLVRFLGGFRRPATGETVRRWGSCQCPRSVHLFYTRGTRFSHLGAD